MLRILFPTLELVVAEKLKITFHIVLFEIQNTEAAPDFSQEVEACKFFFAFVVAGFCINRIVHYKTRIPRQRLNLRLS